MKLDLSLSDDYRLCAVCGRPLDDAFGSYVHLQDLDADHVPVPVRVGELAFAVMRCDFCNDDVVDGGWVLPAEDFRTSAVGGSRDNWSVCGGCLPDVRRKRWSVLAARASRSVGAQQLNQDGPALRKEMLRVYRLLEVHITGEPYPAVVVPNPIA